MQMEECKTSTTLIKQGEAGDYFYVVESGKFIYQVDGKDSGMAQAGSSFGELALMYNAPRAATVVASEDGVLWRLHRDTFRSILASKTSVQTDRIIESLRKVDILNDFPIGQLSR